MLHNALEFEKPIAELEALLVELKKPEKRAEAVEKGIDLDREVARLESQLRQAMEQVYSNLSPWEKTLMSRHRNRPYSLDYIRLAFDDFMEISGDRGGGNDEAVIGGPARLAGRPVFVIGQQKGRDLRERQRRNFGSAHAEGFRKALRIARLAARFGKPLISFVDTAAAAADLHAEERGVSEAIARNLAEFSDLPTPIIVVVIGEGGSGGAIAVAVGDRVLMLEHAVYSVIPPEGCAAILWRDKDQAPEAARALSLTAQSALSLGIIEQVLPEPLGGAHRDPAIMAATVRKALLSHLGELEVLTTEDLLEQRYQRFRRMGLYETEPEPDACASEPLE